MTAVCGKKTLDFSQIDSRILVERYLGHLSESEVIAVNYMHQFELVDKNLMRFLFDAVHLTIDDYVLDRLLERSIFEQVGEGLYKLDATLQSHDILQGALSSQAKKETVSVAYEWMNSRNLLRMEEQYVLVLSDMMERLRCGRDNLQAALDIHQVLFGEDNRE